MRTIKTTRWCVISGRDVPPGALLSLPIEVAEALIAAGDAKPEGEALVPALPHEQPAMPAEENA